MTLTQHDLDRVRSEITNTARRINWRLDDLERSQTDGVKALHVELAALRSELRELRREQQ